MKKIYLLLIPIIFVSGCSKDFLKTYEDRIMGVWQLAEVRRNGIGGNTDHLSFKEGQFTFKEEGQLEYVSTTGNFYKGSWNITRQWINDQEIKMLQITAVDFVSQVIRSEVFNEISFTGTNRFKAFIYSGFQTYIFTFER